MIFSFEKSIKKRFLSIFKFPSCCKILHATTFQLEVTEPLRSLCKKHKRKAAVLLWRCINPCPPSSLGKNNTLWGTQCNLSQKKSTKIAWISANKRRGGSMQASLCHKDDATKLLITKVRPLYDIFGINHFHFSSRPLTFQGVLPNFFVQLLHLLENPQIFKTSSLPY